MECPGGTRGGGEGVSPPPPLKSKCTPPGPWPSPRRVWLFPIRACCLIGPG
jgi:hypothetical protein